jgi:alpha-tubulin suppressor-like RCC1 family protein
VLAWGYNNFGQLGDGTVQNRSVPGPVEIPEKIAAISAGSSHAMALDTSGQVWTWGWNKFGQIGDGTSSSTVFQTQPMRVRNLTGIKAIAAGAAHCLALRDDRRVLAWGDNSTGQLGDGTTTMRTKPTLLDRPRKVAVIAAGFFHSLAVDTERRLWSWGQNDHGQLGDGTVTLSRSVPAPIAFGEVGFPP